MCKIVFSFWLLVLGVTAYGQEGNYLYIDAANGQLFYVKLNNKIHSASVGGYVIIAGIRETTPVLSIGFPGNAFPEQQFVIPMNNSDQGFHLKNAEGNGWQLQNLKTLATIQNSTPPNVSEDPDQIRKSDAFSLLLSKVVNDSSVLFAGTKLKTPPSGKTSVVSITPEPASKIDTTPKEITAASVPPQEKPTANAPVTVNEAIKTDTAATVKELPAVPDTAVVKEAVRMSDTAIAIKETTKDTVQKNTAVLSQVTTQELAKEDYADIIVIPAPVRKLFDQYFEKVYEATYVDKNKGKYDTIKISYPINAETPPAKDIKPVIAVETASGAVPEKVTDTSADKKKKTDAVADKLAESVPAANVPGTASSADAVVVNCKMVANDHDVDNLRVKILGAGNTDDKIGIARIYFGSKCYTVKQIKGLSELFGGDEDKYRFFDAAHPYISDSANFAGLISELKEDYYRNRFKAIIRK